jgi:hypothetical protein
MSFGVLLSVLSVDLLLQVFAAVLLERKVIFCSKGTKVNLFSFAVYCGSANWTLSK